MILAGIIRGIMFDPWRVSAGTKISTDAYIAFLKEHLESWLKMNHFQENHRIQEKKTLLRIQRIKIRSACRNYASVYFGR